MYEWVRDEVIEPHYKAICYYNTGSWNNVRVHAHTHTHTHTHTHNGVSPPHENSHMEEKLPNKKRQRALSGVNNHI